MELSSTAQEPVRWQKLQTRENEAEKRNPVHVGSQTESGT